MVAEAAAAAATREVEEEEGGGEAIRITTDNKAEADTKTTAAEATKVVAEAIREEADTGRAAFSGRCRDSRVIIRRAIRATE